MRLPTPDEMCGGRLTLTAELFGDEYCALTYAIKSRIAFLEWRSYDPASHSAHNAAVSDAQLEILHLKQFLEKHSVSDAPAPPAGGDGGGS